MKKLRQYESFQSVAEMDKTIDLILKEYDLKDSERVILLKLSNYSCKFVGVSYLKNNTLADLTGYSKRTIQRALKRFSELGIITRIEQFKPVKGGYSAFICVINPFESHHELASCKEAAEPTPEQLDEPSHENEAITFKAKSSNNKTYVAHELGLAHLDAIGVPTQFSIAALPYLDVQAVYKLWSKVQMAAKKHAPDLVDTVEIAVSSVRASVLASKVKRVRDFTGYFYGVLAQKLSTAQRSLKCRLFNFLQ
ncbi:helix-turn-helix domain-containing protein [Bacillus cereus group sp. BY9-3LC]|uniref:helix-turn-helix domain-containing protein n=1 Tax=Bacillus cereus group sp. BY9-3LC TaxID=3018075 RepID=UPI0022E38E37|nr:helix-turn-helix domain-containing protein [Bacillus cereus group sp. BY9-3LC]MDA1779676.1 helix-turn-helix domain-containing protein [Bacillus cereus group sp. BY9-3LC]